VSLAVPAKDTIRGRPPRWLYFVVFAVSGFSGLAYESIWTSYLKLFLGHAAYAQSLVLMIFMGGLALGSYIVARFSERWKAPILLYAAVEGVIGLAALVFHSTFVGLSDAFYFSLLPAIGNPLLGGTLKWTAAALLILPQCVLLGMTFPLLSAGILRRYPDHPGGSLAMLYFSNSIGAAIGVLVSGFWLIGLVGLPGTIRTAGVLNVAIAVVVWALIKRDPDADSSPIVAARPAHESGVDRTAALFLLAAGVTGAASFIYEIGWIRMLSLVLGSTTHSFELMLSAFITGLALGGLWIRRRIDAIANATAFAGWVQVAMGLMALATLPLYLKTFDWMAAMLSSLATNGGGYDLFTVFSHVLALIVMVPATFLAGMTLPLFTHALLRTKHGERAIGQVYAANTVGSILGVLFAVHIGLPALGLRSLIGAGAALDIVLGLLLLYCSAPEKHLRFVLRAAVAAAAMLAVVATVHFEPRRLTSGPYRYRRAELNDGTKVMYYKDGKTATVSLALSGTYLAISTNGKPDAAVALGPGISTSDEITMVMAAAVPLAYSPRARHIANIGLGSGLTTHTLLGDPTVEQVDTVEIEAAMVEAAHGFGERVSRAFDDPRSKIHLEDAKTFFSLQNRTFDIIVAEPSNPWVSGVAGLFSQEFYKTLPTYLSPDGIFVQWLQLYEFNDELVQSVLKAIAKSFSDYVVYNTNNIDVLIVAKARGKLPRPSFEHLLNGPLAADLSRVGLHDPADFLARRTGSREIIDALLAQSSVPSNSDYFPFLDLNAGRARFLGQVATMFVDWSIAPLPVLEMTGLGDFDPSWVSANISFRRTVMMDAAKRISRTFSDDSHDISALPPELAVVALLARSCDPTTTDDEWLRGMQTLAANTLAYLPPAEGSDLLRRALPEACLEQAKVSARVLGWLDLYRAVAARDGARMAAAAQPLLEDPRSAESQLHYALEAGMLGYLAAGQPDRTVELWERRPQSLRDTDPPPESKLMLVLAQARLASGDFPEQRVSSK
jgi:spermidine synthase